MMDRIEFGEFGTAMGWSSNQYKCRKLLVMAILLTILFMAVNSVVWAVEEKISTAQDQENIAIAIYNENLALIKDTRKVLLDQDVNRLAWRDVSAQIRSETAILRSLADSTKFQLLEQNFDFDLLTPAKLLEKYMGKEILVIRTNSATGVETSETAIVLSTNEGVILKFNDRIEAGVPGRLVFPGVPQNLRDKPTLLITLLSSKLGKQDLELSYLTQGLSWHADYVIALDETNHLLDLSGLVTLTNRSGIAYHNAKLQLIAGDVNQIQTESHVGRKMMALTTEAADAMRMKQEPLFEYHLYTLQHPTTLLENQTKQVALMSATNIVFNKEYLLQGTDYYYSGKYDMLNQKHKINILINFRNKGEALGITLPKGIARVYKKDSQGNSQFVGEDHIDHTANNEVIRLQLGNAFDITADKIQTDFQQIASTMHHANIFETAYQITLKNAKKETITVKVQEPIPGDWSVISESLPHVKLNAGLAEWQIPVAAESETKLNYRVRVKY